MDSNLSTDDTGAASQGGQPKLFVPFILILLCAVAIGFGIKYYKSRPDTTTQGAWEVYFSEVNAAGSSYSLERRLVDKLGAATMRVDAALYDLDAVPVADAFIKAHNRGVAVRIFTEADNINESEIERLQEVGIPVADDGDNDGLMHHKFIVIDERYVWTGSYNITHNGAYKNNNNVILIDSVQLAYNFTQEFRELFLDAQLGKSSGAFIAYPRVELSDGTEIFTYFSPESDTVSPLLKEIKAAENAIHFMAFSFTHDAIGGAMRDRFQSGIEVRGVFEARQVDQHSEFGKLAAAGLRVVKDGNSGTMHHKVIVVDEDTVITGSYNFSKNAEKRNSENLLIIKGNREIAAAYLAEFKKITR
ncbi:MAG: phospholipase D-like domain-containing protein [Candidatus Poribacteria bacterium]|nr:phospholipase D-like domain-containing protein [Candidatus Poribacteria bacterium]